MNKAVDFARRSLAVILGLAPATSVMAQGAPVLHPDELPVITVSPGVSLKELTGRSAVAGARSDQASVAFFRLEPGRSSAWSHNKVGEESFFVLSGHGQVWNAGRLQAVRAGSFVLIAPSSIRSIHADPDAALEFYAITTPAWSKDDDVLVAAPGKAPW